MTQLPQANAIPRPASAESLSKVSGEPPLKDVLVELWQNMERLFRQELALASVEIDHKAQKLKKELAASAAGAGLVLAGVLALVAALIMLLALVMPAWLAALLTSGAAVGSGVVLLKTQRPTLDELTPKHSLESMKKDLQTFTEAGSK
jgi:hypothetical protein